VYPANLLLSLKCGIAFTDIGFVFKEMHLTLDQNTFKRGYTVYNIHVENLAKLPKIVS